MTDAIVAPLGNFNYQKKKSVIFFSSLEQSYLGFPPPVTGPHLIENPDLSLVISVNALRDIGYKILECRISYQRFHALDWVSMPKLQLLAHGVSVIVK